MSTPPPSSDDADTPDPAPAMKGPSLLLVNPGPENSSPQEPAALAELYELPVIDLRTERIQTEATESIPCTS